jgi:hypothetical protein
MDRDHLEGVSWEISLAGVELAPLIGAYDLASIGDHGGPVEALAERVAHEGVRCRVMAAYTRVDVPDELTALGNRDAPLQDAGRGALVQLAVDEGERLGHPGNAPGLKPIRGKFPSIHPGEVFGLLILRAGGWFCLDGLRLVCPITLQQGEHELLVRGVLVDGLCTRRT